MGFLGNFLRGKETFDTKWVNIKTNKCCGTQDLVLWERKRTASSGWETFVTIISIKTF